jgi:hypothetical protein
MRELSLRKRRPIEEGEPVLKEFPQPPSFIAVQLIDCVCPVLGFPSPSLRWLRVHSRGS